MNQLFPSLQRVFALIKKTGDRCIILSPDDNEAYAVMSLPSYERLALGGSGVADLTEEELLDKINRDIAIWKSQQEEDEIEEPIRPALETNWDDWDEEDEEDYEDDPYYFESIDR